MGDQPIHVLFVTGEYPPLQGGVGAYTAELGRALMGLGLQISVLTAVAAVQDTTAPTSPFPVHPLITRWDWRIWSQIDRHAATCQADWIHVQYQTAAFSMHPAVNFAPAWWRRRRRVAWTYHDLLVPYLFPKAGARLRRWVTERPVTTCDLVIVTNEGDRRQLAGKAARLATIPIGSNISARRWNEAERTARRRQLDYQDRDLVIGYFGFLNRSKGGLTLARTLAELVQDGRNAHLLMIGERVGASDPTNFAYLQEVEALIRQLGLEARVRWTGRQSDLDVGADLCACDVLLLPYEDGASLRRGTLMAGLANGCAIVTTTPQAPLPELVDGSDLLTVPAGDSRAAAAAVARIADDGALRDRLMSNSRAASELFSWDSIARTHRDLYHDRDSDGQ